MDESIDDEALLEILHNTKLSEHFQMFGKELNLTEPRSLEDIYKSHLENTRPGASTANVDSAKQNLAGSFVNAFVNAGFGNEKLMAKAEQGQSWIYKNKDHGMLSAAASLGLSFLWDPEKALDAIDTYTYAPEEYIKAGAMLANGLVHSGIKTEADAAFALLEEHVDSNSVPVKVSAIMGYVTHACNSIAGFNDLSRSSQFFPPLQYWHCICGNRAAGYHGQITTHRIRYEYINGDRFNGFIGFGIHLCWFSRWGSHWIVPPDDDGTPRQGTR